MTSNVDRMLDNLAPDIEQKCKELRAVRKERLQTRAFVILCVMVAVVPALLILAGASLTVLIAPPVFMSLSVILLLPVLFSGKTENYGGIVYEQA